MRAAQGNSGVLDDGGGSSSPELWCTEGGTCRMEVSVPAVQRTGKAALRPSHLHLPSYLLCLSQLCSETGSPLSEKSGSQACQGSERKQSERFRPFVLLTVVNVAPRPALDPFGTKGVLVHGHCYHNAYLGQ